MPREDRPPGPRQHQASHRAIPRKRRQVLPHHLPGLDRHGIEPLGPIENQRRNPGVKLHDDPVLHAILPDPSLTTNRPPSRDRSPAPDTSEIHFRTGTPARTRSQVAAEIPRSRSAYFWIFPVGVFGSSPANSRYRGTMKYGSRSSRNPTSASGVGHRPGFGTITAMTSCSPRSAATGM